MFSDHLIANLLLSVLEKDFENCNQYLMKYEKTWWLNFLAHSVYAYCH